MNIRTGAIAIALGLFVYGVYSFGYGRADQKWQTAWAKRDTDAATAYAEQERKFREREQGLQTKLTDQQVQHDQRLVEMQSLQSDAGAQSDRLRGQVAELRERLRRAGEATSNSGKLPPGTGAAMVLSDLYSSCVGHRQGLAGAFDRARERGLAVEQMYDRARGQ